MHVHYPMCEFTVLILPPDQFSVPCLRQCVASVHPSAVLLIATSIQQARTITLRKDIDLFIIGLDASDGDRLDLLFECAQRPRRIGCTMVLTDRNAPRVLVSLRSLGVEGVFDSGEPAEKFTTALRILAAGQLVWSDAFLAGMHTEQSRIVRHQLTPREQLGLAIIGDGCGDRVAAARLGMEHSSVRSMRCEIYAKLNAHGTDDIVRLAVQLGYTRYSPDGVVTLGLSILIREYETQSKRPIPLPRALLASCGLAPETAAA